MIEFVYIVVQRIYCFLLVLEQEYLFHMLRIVSAYMMRKCIFVKNVENIVYGGIHVYTK
jgi:hypothetical protein